MNPELPPQPIDNPEAEARMIQAESHHEDTTALLGALIQQNENNNQEPLLEIIAVQTEATKKAIEESGEKIIKTISDIQQAFSKIDEYYKALLEVLDRIPVKGDDGHTPIKGVDYLTSSEVEEIKKEVTPIKGKDYQDGKDAIHIGKTPPPNPQKGDLWSKT